MITHRKTRTGCVQCKKRRIKCDETKPQCQKCKRTSRECSFQHPEQQPSSSRTGDSFTLKEMELLHHFVTHTSKTLSDQTEQQHVWQTEVVKIAFQHKFVMHGILAVAALHVSVYRESEKDDLSILAANHQDLGLQGFRSALEDFNPDNCHALFAFSILVACYVIASSGTKFNPNVMTASFLNDVLLAAVVDWIRLWRGTDHIARRGRKCLENGPLAPLLIPESWCAMTEPMDDKALQEDEVLAGLQQLWQPSSPSSIEGVDSEEVLLYDEALYQLRGAFDRMSRARSATNKCTWCFDKTSESHSLLHNISPFIAGYLWFLQLSDEFFHNMEQHKPIALILLAHQAILIKRVGDVWWNRTPAIKVASSVYSTLSPEYHIWLEWPLREIGYNPEA